MHVFSQCFLVNKSAFRYIVLFGNCMDPLDGLIQQLLMKQSNTLFTQCTHIEHMVEGVWIKKIFLQNDSYENLDIFMPPTLKKWGTYWFRLVRMCVCVFVCIHVRDIVLKLHVWIPHGKIADAYFWFSLNYLPLLNFGPLTNKGMKFCKCRISKSIIARNLKLVMLLGDD